MKEKYDTYSKHYTIEPGRCSTLYHMMILVCDKALDIWYCEEYSFSLLQLKTLIKGSLKVNVVESMQTQSIEILNTILLVFFTSSKQYIYNANHEAWYCFVLATYGNYEILNSHKAQSLAVSEQKYVLGRYNS